MIIAEGNTVSIEYTLTIDGDKVDSNVGQSPLDYVQGQSQIVPGLEKQLAGMKVGDEKSVTVDPQEGYGEINEEAVLEVPKEKIPEEAHQVGAVLSIQDEQGQVMQPTVSIIKDTTIVLDFNHPLAGKTLNFDIKIIAIN
jgi:FKBP-type peptidyl-prolyl cis-trans isomerase SlyD